MSAVSRRTFLTLATAATGVGGAAARMPAAFAAGPAAGGACVPDPAHPKRQLRGVWIASVSNINWPSAPGLTAEQQRTELTTMLDRLVALRMNAVYLQVRPAADALYASRLEPWSRYLTGTQGGDPGYDPLEFAVAEAHARNLELHAWLNPYRVSTDTDVDALVPWHAARRHPDWVVSYGGQLYFDPGVPAVHEFDLEVITDIVRRYDVDGIHFDDYVYPYPVGTEQFDDDASFAAYGRGFASRADWRRDNADRLVAAVGPAIHEVKPWVKWGVSPFGIWRNVATDSRGSNTTGLQSYDAIYADSRGWVREGWLDYIAPQVYWNIGFPAAAYDALVPWWSDVVRGTDVQLLIGQDVAKIDTNNPAAWLDPAEMPNHLIFNRSYPAVAGDIYFDVTKLLTDPLGFADRLADDLYADPALVPVMPRLPGAAPAPPALLHARPGASGVALRWFADPLPGAVPAYFAVYRLDGRATSPGCALADAGSLLGTVRAGHSAITSWIDTTAVAGSGYTYVITALDRLHHESEPSNLLAVGTR